MFLLHSEYKQNVYHIFFFFFSPLILLVNNNERPDVSRVFKRYNDPDFYAKANYSHLRYNVVSLEVDKRIATIGKMLDNANSKHIENVIRYAAGF